MSITEQKPKSKTELNSIEDAINDIFGFGITYKYYNTFLASAEKRLLIHNRIFGVAVLTAVAYGHVAV